MELVISDDGSRKRDWGKSEDPWDRGLPHLRGGARSHTSPDTFTVAFFDVCER